MPRFIRLTLLALLSVSAIRGQSSFGQITGAVTDDTGSAIPDASVTARHTNQCLIPNPDQ